MASHRRSMRLSRGIARLVEKIISLRGWVLASIATACLLLGAWGFALYENGVAITPLNVLYESAQLFLWNFSPAEQASLPWQLEIARWMAPLITASALFSALGSVVRRTIQGAQLLEIERFSGHTVIIGLDVKGSAVVQGVLAAGEEAVVIERNPENPNIPATENSDVPVVVGDGTIPAVLDSAGVARAARVVVVCDSEITNIRVAGAIRRYLEGMPGERQETLVVIHISDARIAPGVVRACSSSTANVRVECVDARLSGLSAMLNSVPLSLNSGDGAVIIGDGELAALLVVVVAKRAQVLGCSGPAFRLTLVAPMAGTFIDELIGRYPGLDSLVSIRPVDVKTVRGSIPDWPSAIQSAIAQAPDDAGCYVACDRDEDGVAATILAAAHIGQTSRLGIVLHNPDPYRDLLPSIVRAVPLLGTLFDPAIALGGTRELLAMAIHESYVQRNAPRATGSYLARLEWMDMTKEERAKNRNPAADIPRKLSALGYRMVPITQWDARLTEFTAEERDRLAEMEHERWVEFTKSQGYAFGPVREDSGPHMTHPDLVPWELLKSEDKRKDYEHIDAIPLLLAMIGYRLARRGEEYPTADRMVQEGGGQ